MLCCDPTGVSLVLLHGPYSAALDQQAPSVSLLQQQAFIAVSLQNKHEDDLDLIQKWIEDQWVHDLRLRKKVPEYRIRCDLQPQCLLCITWLLNMLHQHSEQA